VKRFTAILELDDPAEPAEVLEALLAKTLSSTTLVSVINGISIDQTTGLCRVRIDSEAPQEAIRDRLNSASSVGGFRIKEIGWGWSTIHLSNNDGDGAGPDPDDPLASVAVQTERIRLYGRQRGVIVVLLFLAAMLIAGIYLMIFTGYFLGGVLLCLLAGYGAPWPGPMFSLGLIRQVASITCDAQALEFRYWLGLPIRLSWSDIYKIQIFENREKWCLVSTYVERPLLPAAFSMRQFDGITDSLILIKTMINRSNLLYAESVGGNPIYRRFDAP